VAERREDDDGDQDQNQRVLTMPCPLSGHL